MQLLSKKRERNNFNPVISIFIIHLAFLLIVFYSSNQKKIIIFQKVVIHSKLPSVIQKQSHISAQPHSTLRFHSNFSLDKNFHIPNAFRKGGLCIALLSSNRPEYLLRTVSALFYYIQKYEPNLDYSLVWVDTATKDSNQLSIELDKKYHVDKRAFLSTFANSKIYEGVTMSYKIALTLCEKNDYFMPLEEDWVLIDNPKIGFIQKTMEILNKAPHSLMGINFKDTDEKEGPIDFLSIDVNGELYNITCQKKRGFQFVNGASIYRMSNMKELIKDGIIETTSFELSCTEYARKYGMYFGFIDFIENCTKPKGDCYGVFHHIGRWSSVWGVYRKN